MIKIYTKTHQIAPFIYFHVEIHVNYSCTHILECSEAIDSFPGKKLKM